MLEPHSYSIIDGENICILKDSKKRKEIDREGADFLASKGSMLNKYAESHANFLSSCLNVYPKAFLESISSSNLLDSWRDNAFYCTTWEIEMSNILHILLMESLLNCVIPCMNILRWAYSYRF